MEIRFAALWELTNQLKEQDKHMHNAAQIKSLSCKSYSSFSVSDVTQSHPNSLSKKPPAH